MVNHVSIMAEEGVINAEMAEVEESGEETTQKGKKSLPEDDLVPAPGTDNHFVIVGQTKHYFFNQESYDKGIAPFSWKVSNWSGNVVEMMNLLLCCTAGIFVETIAEFMESIAYEGFDAVAIADAFKKANIGCIKRMFKDIIKLVTFVINRGTQVQKAVKKMKPSGVKELGDLVKRYKIQATGGNLRTTVTMGRILATFPMYAAEVIARGLGRVIGEVPPGLPRFYAFPGGAALIGPDDTVTFDLWLVWQSNFAKVIGGQIDPRTQRSIGESSWKNSCIDKKKRAEWVQRLAKLLELAREKPSGVLPFPTSMKDVETFMVNTASTVTDLGSGPKYLPGEQYQMPARRLNDLIDLGQPASLVNARQSAMDALSDLSAEDIKSLLQSRLKTDTASVERTQQSAVDVTKNVIQQDNVDSSSTGQEPTKSEERSRTVATKQKEHMQIKPRQPDEAASSSSATSSSRTTAIIPLVQQPQLPLTPRTATQKEDSELLLKFRAMKEKREAASDTEDAVDLASARTEEDLPVVPDDSSTSQPTIQLQHEDETSVVMIPEKGTNKAVRDAAKRLALERGQADVSDISDSEGTRVTQPVSGADV